MEDISYSQSWNAAAVSNIILCVLQVRREHSCETARRARGSKKLPEARNNRKASSAKSVVSTFTAFTEEKLILPTEEAEHKEEDEYDWSETGIS